jgi:ABC-2 type transport system permease protein
MTATTLPTGTASQRVTQMRVALSEWTKFRSLRSTRYTLLVGIGATIVFAIVPALINASRWSTMNLQDKLLFNPLETSLIGVGVAQLAIGVLGVLVITGEYSTGMIRATFCAVPKRLPVLWAKVGVFGGLTLILSVPAMLIAFFSAQAILSGHTLFGRDIAVSISDPGVARVVVGGALYLTLAGLFGLGLGAVLRNTAAGIGSFAAVLFVIPPLMNLLPTSWDNAISPYLPSNAGQAIMQFGRSSDTLAPWTGLGLFATYTAATIAVAAVLLRRREV